MEAAKLVLGAILGFLLFTMRRRRAKAKGATV